jgi:hypothetical protein
VFIPCKLGFGVAFNATVVIDGFGLVVIDGFGLVLTDGVGVELLHVHVACGVVAKGVVGAGYALQAGQAGHTGGTISVFKIYLSLKQSGIWSNVTPFGNTEVKLGGVE